MKRVTYLGGSTIVGFGARRAAAWEGNDNRRTPRRKRRPKVKESALIRTAAPSPLCIPSDTVRLISSVMKDLGQPLPTRIKPLNRALRKLIIDGLVTEAGVLNRSHPLLLRWLERVDRKV